MRIREVRLGDEEKLYQMMRVFYDSPALILDVSDAQLRCNIRDCISELPFLEGYMFENEDTVIGYAMIARSYSTEAGGQCIWIEDLYLEPEYRGQGLGMEFFTFIEKRYGAIAKRFRLEVEPENERAIALYEKAGYKVLPYEQRIIDK